MKKLGIIILCVGTFFFLLTFMADNSSQKEEQNRLLQQQIETQKQQTEAIEKQTRTQDYNARKSQPTILDQNKPQHVIIDNQPSRIKPPSPTYSTPNPPSSNKVEIGDY